MNQNVHVDIHVSRLFTHLEVRPSVGDIPTARPQERGKEALRYHGCKADNTTDRRAARSGDRALHSHKAQASLRSPKARFARDDRPAARPQERGRGKVSDTTQRQVESTLIELPTPPSYSRPRMVYQNTDGRLKINRHHQRIGSIATPLILNSTGLLRRNKGQTLTNSGTLML